MYAGSEQGQRVYGISRQGRGNVPVLNNAGSLEPENVHDGGEWLPRNLHLRVNPTSPVAKRVSQNCEGSDFEDRTNVVIAFCRPLRAYGLCWM